MYDPDTQPGAKRGAKRKQAKGEDAFASADDYAGLVEHSMAGAEAGKQPAVPEQTQQAGGKRRRAPAVAGLARGSKIARTGSAASKPAAAGSRTKRSNAGKKKKS